MIEFICHKDFEDVEPINVFHKENIKVDLAEKDGKFLNRHVLFRKKFTLESASDAVMKITADDYYKLYINGKFVTMGPAASYPHCYNYNEIDVSEYVRKGENTVAVHTYYQGLINRVWVSADRRAMLWCELTLDGKQALVSDTSWKCHAHTGYTQCGIIGYDTQFMECYDSGSAEVGFWKEDFDDSDWENARVYKNADYVLQKQQTQQLELYSVRAVSSETVGNTLRLDFGKEMVGYLCATAKGRKGDKVVLRYGEELLEDGAVRYDMRCNCVYEEKWILSGDEDTLEQYDYKAFRYAEVIFPEGVEIKDVYMLVRHYPYVRRAVFDTDSEELQRIIALCEDTVKYGMQENFVDCPTREKGQYLGDVSIAARAHAVLTGDTLMMKKAIKDFCNSDFICKGLMSVSTSSLMQEIADYSLQFPAQVCWVYKTDGDIEFLRYAEPYVTAMYEYFLGYQREDGLLENLFDKWNMVDWPKNLRDGYDFPLTRPIGEGLHNVLNAFWCGFLQSVDELYGYLGKAPTGMTERIKRAFIEAFYSKERGLFCDSAEHTHSAIHSNVLPLLFDIGTEDEGLRERLIKFVAEKKLTSMGVYMAYFTLAALMKHGRKDLALELTLSPDCWLNMIAEGATTTFEAWGKDQKWNTSLFHPWATAPIIIFAKETCIY